MKVNSKNNVIDIKSYNQLFFIFCFMVLLTMIPFDSFAASNDAISNTLCNILKKLTGPIGKGIATIAIIVLGIGLFLGKLSWSVAVATALGIGLIFGAGSMVEWIGAGSSAGSSGTGNGVTGSAC